MFQVGLKYGLYLHGDITRQVSTIWFLCVILFTNARVTFSTNERHVVRGLFRYLATRLVRYSVLTFTKQDSHNITFWSNSTAQSCNYNKIVYIFTIAFHCCEVQSELRIRPSGVSSYIVNTIIAVYSLYPWQKSGIQQLSEEKNMIPRK